jgi:hypothetical protein
MTFEEALHKLRHTHPMILRTDGDPMLAIAEQVEANRKAMEELMAAETRMLSLLQAVHELPNTAIEFSQSIAGHELEKEELSSVISGHHFQHGTLIALSKTNADELADAILLHKYMKEALPPKAPDLTSAPVVDNNASG